MCPKISPKLFFASMILMIVLAFSNALAQPGSFDTAFGGTGVFTYSAASLPYIWDQAVQSDGKLVTLSHGTINGVYMTRLMRLNTDGTLDPSFDNDGILDFYWADAALWTPRAFSVAIQNIGGTDRIVASGLELIPTSRRNYAVALRIDRFNLDGTLDSSFGSGGTFATTAVGGSLKMRVRPSDQALLHYSEFQDVDRIGCVTANGSGLCPGFGTGGMFTVNGVGNGNRALALDSQERILVQTTLTTGKGKTGVTNNVVTRYTANGSIDTSFGTNGTAIVGPSSTTRAYDLTVDSLDRPVLAGTLAVGGDWDMSVFRLTSNGAIDTSFNGTGRSSVDFAGFNDVVRGLATQSDGKVIITGAANYSGEVAAQDFAVVRFNSDGTLDTGFGNGGSVQWDIGPADMLYAASVVSIGGVEKIIVAGGSPPYSVVARLHRD